MRVGDSGVEQAGGRVGARRWSRRALAWLLLGVLSLLLAGVWWAWLGYQGLVHDVGASNRRVPRAVTRVLGSAGDVTSAPQLLLVEAVGHIRDRPAGSVVLAATDPNRHLVGVLSIPPATRLAASTTVAATLSRGGTAGLIRSLSGDGLRVNHIILIDLTQLSRIVDAIGGITFWNHVPLTYRQRDGAMVQIPAGKVSLSGSQAAAYLLPSQLARTLGVSTLERQQTVLRALTAKLLHPGSLSRLTHFAHVIASIRTDLSPSEVIGLTALSLDTQRLVECNLPQGFLLTADVAQTALNGSFAPVTSASVDTVAASICRVHALNAPVHGAAASALLPLAKHLPGLSGWLLTVVAAVWVLTLGAMLATSQRLRAAAAGSIVGGRRLALSGWRLAWDLGHRRVEIERRAATSTRRVARAVSPTAARSTQKARSAADSHRAASIATAAVTAQTGLHHSIAALPSHARAALGAVPAMAIRRAAEALTTARGIAASLRQRAASARAAVTQLAGHWSPPRMPGRDAIGISGIRDRLPAAYKHLHLRKLAMYAVLVAVQLALAYSVVSILG